MESALKNACTIKLNNFEGPFDLLFHLIEKNQINIYDIPISEITDQYMDYLFAMKQLDLEIASEFLLVAATLLHIKSKMLLPDRNEVEDEGIDPREELVYKLLQYKKYKEFSEVLRQRESQWSKLFYKLPEMMDEGFYECYDISELSGEILKDTYMELLSRNKRKMNPNVSQIKQIVKSERISVKSKIREIIKFLIKTPVFIFSEMFSFKNKSREEVITGFLAILELARIRVVSIEQKRQLDDLYVQRTHEELEEAEEKISEAG